MIIFKQITPLHKYLARARKTAKIGFVPTMGALHSGHLQLVRTSKEENGCTLASIFVNPAQFNDARDFQKYPVTIENDIRLLEKQGCDVLFLPSVDEIYPDGFRQPEHYDLGRLDEILEGKYRPGHFQGVCMVVNRLLDIAEPDHLYLGQKDYQQCMVIRRLVELTGKTTEIRICPTLREDDGLAMSSRNLRLDQQDRQKAPLLYRQLVYARDHIKKGSLLALQHEILNDLKDGGFKPDYFEFANADDLTILHAWDGQEKVVAITAAFLNDVRLIDNMIIT